MVSEISVIDTLTSVVGYGTLAQFNNSTHITELSKDKLRNMRTCSLRHAITLHK